MAHFGRSGDSVAGLIRYGTVHRLGALVSLVFLGRDDWSATLEFAGEALLEMRRQAEVRSSLFLLVVARRGWTAGRLGGGVRMSTISPAQKDGQRAPSCDWLRVPENSSRSVASVAQSAGETGWSGATVAFTCTARRDPGEQGEPYAARRSDMAAFYQGLLHTRGALLVELPRQKSPSSTQPKAKESP